jgi:hypothetical protein
MISSIKKQVKGAIVIGVLLMGSNAFAQLGLTWGEMGPNDIAGRCRSIIVDKTDATGNKMFAAGVSGGVFKSTNGGSTWSPVNDLAPSLIVSCMAQDAAGNILFGTGESFGRGLDGAGSSGFIGDGLFKIMANSSTIVQLQTASSYGNINEIAIDGANNIYMATDAGFFISTDGGSSFNEETISATSTISPSALDVKVAKNGDIYYSSYAASTSSTGVAYVYYCPVGSTTFSDITPPAITSINRCRIEIATSPVNTNYVYLSVSKLSGDLGAVLVSDDKGSNWATITLGSTQFDPFFGGGNYSNTIVADPIRADACYLGSFLFYRWEQIPSNSLGQGTWSQIGTPANIPFAIYIHSYVHDVKFNAGNGSMYIATDGGIFKSVSSNSGFLPYNNGFNISQFYSVAFPIFPRANQTSSNTLAPYAGVAGGSIGNSLTYLPGSLSNGPMTSLSFGSNDGFQADFSRIIPKALIYSEAYGSIFRTNDVDITPPSTFYDISFKNDATGGPGSSTFANENTPLRLWENYSNGDSTIFYNEIIKKDIINNNATQTTFTFVNVRPQASSKYDTIFVQPVSTKKAFQPLAVTQTFTNSNTSASSFTINNTRTNVISKYDSVTVKMTSFKKSNTTVIVPSYTNTNNTAATFTLANIRPMASAKYDSIIVKSTSFKLDTTLASPTKKTIIIRPTYSLNTITGYAITGGPTGTANIVYLDNTTFNDSIRFTFSLAPKDSTTFDIRIKYKYAQTIYIMPVYTGSVLTSHNVLGEANNVPSANNAITLNNTTLIDNIRYTFIDPPNDSSVISVRTKNKFYQTLKIMPAYSGTAITSYSLIGESNNTPTTNIRVILDNSTLADTIRYTFKNAPNDSSVLQNTIKYRYDAGDIISVTNNDISGDIFTSTVSLTSPLAASITPLPTVKVPLARSARIAVGINEKSGSGPSIYAVKRPLNFAINPDWVKIAGKFSRQDSAAGMPYLAMPNAIATSPIKGTTVTHLEWAPDGSCIYFTTKLNNSAYFLYRISHLQFVGDSASADYGGIFSSDVDSTSSVMRKAVKQRTTPIGMFTDPITGIAITADNANLMVTTGGYNNTTGTVYYSNSDPRAMNTNSVDATNFSVKNGTGPGGLPLIPAYTSLFEMTDNKRALVGTENGVYSTTDITQASPSWVKESGGNFPNVPVFQIRQQTYPSYKCYNSGVIYAATHGRGIWSTDKFFTPYAIGIEEQEKVDYNFSSNVKLFPNPANDATNVWFKATSDASYKVSVYDINGRLMIEQTTAKLTEGEQVISLNTSALTSGVYFVSVTGSNNSSVNTKLVITH